MTSSPLRIAEELRTMIEDGRVSLDAVQRMTGIETESLQAFLDDERSPSGAELLLAETPIMPGDAGRLSTLVAQLTEGLQINDDERVQGILDSLVMSCGLTPGNLARLLQVDEDVLRGALEDIGSVPANVRYALGVRGSYLIGAINQAMR